jgi:hypothetical protein
MTVDRFSGTDCTCFSKVVLKLYEHTGCQQQLTDGEPEQSPGKASPSALGSLLSADVETVESKARMQTASKTPAACSIAVNSFKFVYVVVFDECFTIQIAKYHNPVRRTTASQGRCLCHMPHSPAPSVEQWHLHHCYVLLEVLNLSLQSAY